MCIVHVSPKHYSMVIVLKQDLRVDLIWCDSLQRDGRQPLNTYAQYYHFLEMKTNRPQAFQPMRHYTSALRMRTHTPVLSRQCNGTDCGIFTLLYQQTVSNWYGAAAGQTFTDAQIQALLNSLRTINQDAASRHRALTCTPGGGATGKVQTQSPRQARTNGRCKRDANDAGCRRPA